MYKTHARQKKRQMCKNNITTHVSKNSELMLLKQQHKNSFLKNNVSEFILKLQKKIFLDLTKIPNYFKHKNLSLWIVSLCRTKLKQQLSS